MDLANPSSIRDKYPATSARSSFAERVQSWAPNKHDDDLFDPPNTAEAFAQLEAAIDEANCYGSAHIRRSAEDMFDPPTTAERFARIEAAIDEDAARAKIRFATPTHPRLFAAQSHGSLQRREMMASSDKHRLKKRPSQLTGQSSRVGISYPGANTAEASGIGRLNTGLACPHSSEDWSQVASKKSSKTPSRTISDFHSGIGKIPTPRSDHANPSHDGNAPPHRESDIFRSSSAMRNFMDDAFDKARRKYA